MMKQQMFLTSLLVANMKIKDKTERSKNDGMNECEMIKRQV